MQEILVPDIGDFKNVEVIDVLVKPGDTVTPEMPLITIETEKATMDVPSPDGGVVKSVVVKKGDRVSKGSVMITLDAEAASEKAPAAKTEPDTADVPFVDTLIRKDGDPVIPAAAKPAPAAT